MHIGFTSHVFFWLRCSHLVALSLKRCSSSKSNSSTNTVAGFVLEYRWLLPLTHGALSDHDKVPGGWQDSSVQLNFHSVAVTLLGFLQIQMTLWFSCDALERRRTRRTKKKGAKRRFRKTRCHLPLFFVGSSAPLFGQCL